MCFAGSVRIDAIDTGNADRFRSRAGMAQLISRE